MGLRLVGIVIINKITLAYILSTPCARNRNHLLNIVVARSEMKGTVSSELRLHSITSCGIRDVWVCLTNNNLLHRSIIADHSAMLLICKRYPILRLQNFVVIDANYLSLWLLHPLNSANGVLGMSYEVLFTVE